MDNRGQLSWVWVMMVTILGLGVAVYAWIFIDDLQANLHDSAVASGANLVNLTTLEGLLSLAPFAMLAGFILYVLIMSSANYAQ